MEDVDVIERKNPAHKAPRQKRVDTPKFRCPIEKRSPSISSDRTAPWGRSNRGCASFKVPWIRGEPQGMEMEWGESKTISMINSVLVYCRH